MKILFSVNILCAFLMSGLSLAQEAPTEPIQLSIEADEGILYSILEDRDKAKMIEFKAKASSTLCEKSGKKKLCHKASRLTDEKDKTAWCEGAAGNGLGQQVTLDLGKTRSVTSLYIVPFYARNKDTMFKNARVKKLLLSAAEQLFEVTLPDADPKYAFIKGAQIDFPAYAINFLETGSYKRPLKTRHITLTLISVYPGTKYQDLCISTLRIFAQ